MPLFHSLLLVLALICFIAGAVKPSAFGNINPVALGLAFWVLNVLVAIVPR